MRLIVHAPNVHQGGGKALLSALLDALPATDVAATVVVDARLPLESVQASAVEIVRVAPTLAGRLAAEWRLHTRAAPGDVVLCFGNLPPLFRTAARVVLFLQSRYLLRSRDLREFPLPVRLRIRAERAWLRARLSAATTIVVQSRSMAYEVERELGRQAAVAPFAARDLVAGWRETGTGRDAAQGVDFLYVSSGDPHKNHANLFAAWELLARDGIRPSLYVTVDPEGYPRHCEEMRRARERSGVNITNVGVVPDAVIRDLYARSSALIFPSMFESFGLPLLEARAAGLPVLAPELDYVRDILDPNQSFDPASALSIARAVRRFLGRDDPPDLLDAEAFVAKLMSGAIQ